jgi:broad specificity phosphatase PhoE
MKKIFLVRHGESEGNISTLRQSSISPLSEAGEKQAESVTKRFENISIDKIISSPQTRAKHTAEAINSVLNKQIEFSDLLIERKRPSSLIGKPKKDPFVLEIDKQIDEHFHEIGWRHSDEENFEDLKNRAIKLFEYIETLKDENILVVTHGVFMRMIAAYIVLGKKLTSHEYWEFFIVLEVGNTGVTVLEQSQFGGEESRWHIVTWNDQSHLSEIK